MQDSQFKKFGDELGFDGNVDVQDCIPSSQRHSLKPLKVDINDNYNYALAA